MDYFAEVQISSQGNTQTRKRWVVTPTQAPVEVQHLPREQSCAIVDRLKLNKELTLQNAFKDARERVAAAVALPREEKVALAWAKAKTHCSILRWVPALNWAIIKADVAAGLTVGVMVIPQSMSYANIAGLQYVYGMYSAFAPTIVYAVLGNSRHQVVGPVAIMCLLIEVGLSGRLSEEECPAYFAQPEGATRLAQHQLCPDEYARLAMLLAFLVGILQLCGGVLNVGFLVSFLGHPVMSGFTSGAAIIIGLSQLKDWLGFRVPQSPYIYRTLGHILTNLDKTNGASLGLGIAFFVVLYAMRWAAGKYKALAFLRAAGPLIMCLLGVCMMWASPYLRDELGIEIVGEIPEGLPPFSGGALKTRTLDRVLTPAISVAVIGYMELIAIGKSLAAKHGYELPAGQELMAVGVANVVGSLTSSFPVSGSFSRSAVNNAVGAKSQLASFITGVIMFLTLLVLTPVFFYLPKFALASVVISSVITLVAINDAKELWRVKKSDWFLWTFAFFATLFIGVEEGIAAAVGVSLVIVIYESVRPQICVLWRLPGTEIYRNVKQENDGQFVQGVLIVRVGASMYFANVAYIRETILAYIAEYSAVSEVKYVVIEMTAVISIDSTAIHSLEGLVKDLRMKKIALAFTTVGNRVEKTMKLAKLYDLIGKDWFHARVHDAVVHCLSHELNELEPVGQNAFLLPVAEMDAAEGARPRARRGVGSPGVGNGRSEGDTSEEEAVTPGARVTHPV